MRECEHLIRGLPVRAEPSVAAGAGTDRRSIHLTANKAASHVLDLTLHMLVLKALRRRGGAVSKRALYGGMTIRMNPYRREINRHECIYERSIEPEPGW